MNPVNKGGDKSLSLQSLMSPQEMLRESQAEIRTLRQFSRKQCFIVPVQTQQTRVQQVNPENKEGSPCISFQAGYRSKKQSSTHIWLHVTLLAISFLQCYATFFMFQFFMFYFSACHPFPLPHYQNTACLFLF
jgi:hypothetical protein